MGIGKAYDPHAYERRLMAQPLRPLRPDERALVVALVTAAQLDPRFAAADFLDAARVRDMLDGGMGSLRFATPADRLGGTPARATPDAWYVDTDGVPVSFCLMLDQHGELYELDAWKVDFSALRRYPDPADLRPTPPTPFETA
jgi:hypothetical protein